MDTVKQHIIGMASAIGAYRTGFAEAVPVDRAAQERYRQWIEAGHHGTMAYCARYDDVRRDPRLLLDDAKTVICCAFVYRPDGEDAKYYKDPSSYAPAFGGAIATYAMSADYHLLLRERLETLAADIRQHYGGCTRVLTDTAPMRERYWAQRAGLGFVGINNQLIVPGAGSYVFLGEVLWTGRMAADTPCTDSCNGCGACVRACPGGALDGHGGCDARRCVSYLTIEHRGPIPDDANLGGWIYGCDICQRVCPHNHDVSAQNTLFKADGPLMSLTPNDLRGMSHSRWRRLSAGSAMSRVTPAMLLRNIDHQRGRPDPTVTATNRQTTGPDLGHTQ